MRALGPAILVLLVAIGGDVAAQYWTAAPMNDALLSGNWQSCRDADGYAEAVVDLRPPHGQAFELHMGPYHDFAVFRGIQDAHRDHDGPENLLRPHVVGAEGEQIGRQRWRVLGYELEVALAGGSRGECEGDYIFHKPIE